MADLMIPIFRVKDARQTAEWYKRLGFRVTGEHQFDQGMPFYLFLERNGVELHLSEHRGDAPKKSLAYFWTDEDLTPIAGEFGLEIEQAPWAKELKLVDPDGNRIRLAQRNTGTD